MFIRRSINARKANGKDMFVALRKGALLLLSSIAALNLQAQQWNVLGPATGISPNWGSFQHLVKDTSGNLYASFYDGSVSLGSVMKYNGTAWSYLGGTAGITTGTATYNALAVASNGDVFYSNQASAGLEVRKYSNNAWSLLPLAATTTVNFQSMVIGTGNQPYVAYSSGGVPVVKKYDGTAWQTIGTGLPSGTPYYLDLKAGSNDSIYVSFVNSGMKVYKIHINASATATWEELGTTGFAATSSEQYRSAMAVDASNNVYVAFTSLSAGGNKINVKKYSAGQWSDVGSANFSDFRVHYVSMAVSNTGIPYVAFSNFENSPNNKNSVMKFNGTQWELVGSSGISGGEAKWNALLIDNTGAPVLSYSDASMTAGNMVKRFTPGSGCTNTMPGTTAGDLGCVTFNYQGQPVTYTTVRAADGNVWLQQNLGAGAVATSKIDTVAYGHLFQWGRWDDGHQLRSATTGVIPAVNNPSGVGANPNFFTGTGANAWWNGGQLTDTWSAAAATSVTSTNGADPCKAIGANWHLPSQAEWVDVVADEAITTPDLAFSSNLKLVVAGSRSSSSGAFDFVGTRGYYWSTTTSSTGGKYYYYSAAVNNTGAGNLRGGGASVRCLNTTGSVSITDSVKVTTQNNVAAQITTSTGTLQMNATVYPLAASQSVTWSIIAGTGSAAINAAGLVTAQSNGTVWAKAVSVANPLKMDSLQITISGYCDAYYTSGCSTLSIDSVKTTGGVTNISNLNSGCSAGVGMQNGYGNFTASSVSAAQGATVTLTVSMSANTGYTSVWADWNQNFIFESTELVYQATAASSNAVVTINVPSNATLGSTRMRIRTVEGAAGPAACGSSAIGEAEDYTFTVTVPVVTEVIVTTQNNVPAVINTLGGTLSMAASVLPAVMSQAVSWSIVPVTGAATVNTSGLVTAQTDGTVWAKAVSVEDAAMSDSMLVTITNQVTPPAGIDSVVVRTQNNVTAVINTPSGTLPLQAVVYPAAASQDVTWSISSASVLATVSSTGVVTAQANGTVWIRAVSNTDNTKSDSLRVTISGQTGTGIDQLGNLKAVKVYPNPASQEVFIEFTGAHSDLDITLTNVYGRIVHHRKTEARTTGSVIPFDLGQTPGGIYFITVTGERIHLVRKMIKY